MAGVFHMQIMVNMEENVFFTFVCLCNVDETYH